MFFLLNIFFIKVLRGLCNCVENVENGEGEGLNTPRNTKNLVQRFIEKWVAKFLIIKNQRAK